MLGEASRTAASPALAADRSLCQNEPRERRAGGARCLDTLPLYNYLRTMAISLTGASRAAVDKVTCAKAWLCACFGHGQRSRLVRPIYRPDNLRGRRSGAVESTQLQPVLHTTICAPLAGWHLATLTVPMTGFPPWEDCVPGGSSPGARGSVLLISAMRISEAIRECCRGNAISPSARDYVELSAWAGPGETSRRRSTRQCVAA